MRAGLSTIQQTLTPEAASVLNQSIAEAARRSHSQTTPLHVAATLLASPTGLFRQACVRSHSNSSHPLQCRALDLCFSVALDRLPSSVPSNSNPSTSSSDQGGGGGNVSASSSGVPALALEQPPISNALMAALKRAQAHQRRGCPEQQQQPLLAVKVELEQLVISILDDPSVSRVMREASFSSPAVKAMIQQSLVASTPSTVTTTTFSPSPSSASTDSRPIGNGAAGGQLGVLRPSLVAPGAPLLPANRNLYLNPRLQQQQQQQGSGGVGDGFEHHRGKEVKRVLDILLREKKRNPVLVSDSESEVLVKEVLQRVERREAGEGPLRNVEVISLEKQLASDRSQIPLKLRELGNSIDLRLKNGAGGDAAGVGGVVLDLGDLRWLVENPGGGIGGSPVSVPIHQQQKFVLEVGRAAVAEMAKLLGRFADGTGGRIWLIGTATCATYLRCQVYHPTMENDWDLQAVPIAAGAPLPGMLPRVGGRGILSSSVESLSIQKGFPSIGATTGITARRPSENTEPSRRTMCPACTEGYERELAKLVANEFEKSSAESKPEPRQPLPPWLQLANLGNANAKPPASQLQTKEQELKRKQSSEELLKRWTETCSRLHPSVHQAGGGHDKPMTPLLPMSNMHSSNLLLRQNFQAKLQPARRCGPLQVSNQSSPAMNTSGRHASPPGSPVTTDLVLWRAKPPCEKSPESCHRERLEDSAGCTQDGFSERNRDKVVGNVDLDSFKRLLKSLTEKVAWQPEAASLVAATVIQCKSGDRKRRGAGVRGDAWLLFMGPDKVGKKKMAMALSELVAGSRPVIVSFGDSQVDGDNAEPNASFRGKTALDRVVEAVRRNPFSVVVLEDIDRADMLVQGNLRSAMERGRLPDSHGREVALGSVIFIMISHALPENLKPSMDTPMQYEDKLSSAANSGMQLELAVGEKPGKRRAEWTRDEDDRVTKPRKRTLGPPGLSLDLNLAAACDEGATECSPNSSDLTVEHEHNECGRLAVFNRFPKLTISELVGAVDEAVVFKPVDFGELQRKVSDAITRRFRSVVCDGRSLWLDEEALDRVVGGVWFGATPATGFEDWTERVLVPGFQQVRSHAAADGSTVVRLLLVKDGCAPRGAAAARSMEWLPSKVTVAVDGP